MWIKLHSQQQQQQQQQQQKTKFLPMLCSTLSIKEANRPPPLHRRCSSTSSSSEEPSSPRVGCMGQVKRKNKVVGFPTVFDVAVNDVTKKTDHTRKNAVKYQKLRSFFFASSSSPNPGIRNPGSGTHKCRSSTVRNSSSNIAVSSTRCTVRTCRSVTDDNNRSDSSSCSSVRNVVNLEEMDPPLPVVRKKQEGGGCNEERSNLWKRRSGGTPLKTLQLQPLNTVQNRVSLCSASTV